jgi:Tol biopolymer transport system component
MSGPRFSPDGQSVLVCGTTLESGRGLYKVDMETGLVTLIHGPCEKNVKSAAWSQDGSSIYIRSSYRIRRLELATGRETTLYKGPSWGPWSFDVSPDGQWLAFYPTEDSLAVMPAAGGEPREVLDIKGNGGNTNNFFIRWTPDGKHLLFSKRSNELWKVNVETGEQQQIGPAIENLVGAAMHPDGRQITFTVEQLGSELWVMENFLPD